MITVTYKCDRCGAEQKKPDQFWHIKVSFEPHQNGSCREYADRQIHVCRACLETFGLVPSIIQVEPTPPPTIEELIREVISRCTEES
jgi:hypothetical protein